MDYFIPTHMRGRLATPEQRTAAEAQGKDPTAFGVPYEFFRGIHHVPDALANSHEANTLGIVPVEEMSDEDWRLLGLDRDVWMASNRPQPEAPVEALEKPKDVKSGDPVTDQPADTAKASAAA